MSQPFVLLAAGDLSGRDDRSDRADPPPPPRILSLDRDVLDAVLKRVAPEVRLDGRTPLRFASMDDFHPDAIASRLPSIGTLLEARSAVGDPRAMRTLLAAAGVAAEAIEGPPASETPAEGAAPARSGADVLADLLGDARPVEAPPAPRGADHEFARMVEEIVGPYADRTDYARQERWRSAIDRETSARMRALLRNAAFRRLESLWRSLEQLVREPDDEGRFRVRAVDVARGEILREIGAGNGASALSRLVAEACEGARGTRPFRLLLWSGELDGGDEDASLLRHLASVASLAGAPVAVAVRSTEAAQRLRAAAPGAPVALLAGRVLLRLPYGARTSRVERFGFEEIGEDEEETPGALLWGSPVFAFARILARSLSGDGSAQLDGLPLHVLRSGEGTLGPTHPLLSDSALEQLAAAGIMPLAGARDRGTAAFPVFQTVTNQPLFG